MTTAIQTMLPYREDILPNDLREWIDEYTLARLVLAAVRDGTVPIAHTADVAGRNADCQPHVLLSLLTYCYTTGILSSTDIELSSTQDKMVRHLCANTYPEAQQIRWFRRNDRRSIQKSLTEVLYRAWRIRCRLDESVSDAPADFINPCFEEGVDEQAARFFAAEAEDRINRAVRLDCGSFDY